MWQPPDRDRDRQRDRDDLDDRIAHAVTGLAAAAALSVVWPLAITAAAALAAAWLTGMHPARLARAARTSTAMTAVYVIAATVQDRPWAPGSLTAWALQPYRDWKRATASVIAFHGSRAHLHASVHAARIPAALLTVAPVAVPAGIAIAAAAWAWHCHQMTHGLMGATALSAVSWDDRQWRRQARTAARDARQPGRVPQVNRHGVPAGTVIRVIRARWSRVLVIPLAEFSRHMVIVGASGSGKTTLMIRLWSSWFAAWAASRQDQPAPRPLLVVIDGKGGHDSRARAVETYAALTAAGAGRIGIWPHHPLSLWDIAPRELSALLHQLIEHGDGAASYYADISQAAIRLAVLAPAGPPRSSAEFLDRLSAGWLERAYAEGRPAELEQVTAAKPHLGDIAMRYTVLLDRLGGALDGGHKLEDADAWYCILEGTAEPSVAEAQAMALIELVARAAASPAGPRRSILLAADDYSAVSRRVPLSNLYERGRSLGLGVQVSAQSWEGLGADEDERKRITSTADGGIWLLRTPSPEPLVSLAGTRRILESGRKLLGAGKTGDEGTSRVAHTWTVDPDRIRQLATGQAAYIRHGAATFVHVSPAAIPPQPPATQRPAPEQAPQPGRRPPPPPLPLPPRARPLPPPPGR